MRNPSKGRMQSVASNFSIYCPKCGKPAEQMTDRGTEKEYLHATRKGPVSHVVKDITQPFPR